MFLSLLSLSLILDPKVLHLSNGKKIEIQEEKRIKAFDSGWYYLYLEGKISHSFPFKIDSSSYIMGNWHRIYMTNNDIGIIRREKGISLIPISSDDKIIEEGTKLNEAEYFLIMHHSSFIPPVSSLFNYSESFKEFSHVKTHDSEELVKQFSKIPEVYQIIPLPRVYLHNRYAGGLIQSGQTYPSYTQKQYGLYHEMNEKGLNGENQTIAIIDSGLDYYNGYFYDPNVPNPLIEGATGHRKIAQYINYSDSNDYTGGHGTHVSGIAVGSALCSDCGQASYNGVAPSAKVVFIDCGVGSSSTLNIYPVSSLIKLFSNSSIVVKLN